jgi:hypothetical protein
MVAAHRLKAQKSLVVIKPEFWQHFVGHGISYRNIARKLQSAQAAMAYRLVQ